MNSIVIAETMFNHSTGVRVQSDKAEIQIVYILRLLMLNDYASESEFDRLKPIIT